MSNFYLEAELKVLRLLKPTSDAARLCVAISNVHIREAEAILIHEDRGDWMGFRSKTEDLLLRFRRLTDEYERIKSEVVSKYYQKDFTIELQDFTVISFDKRTNKIFVNKEGQDVEVL